MDPQDPVDAINGDIDDFVDTLLREQSDTEAFNRSINDIIRLWYSTSPATIVSKVFDIAGEKGANATKMEDILRSIQPAWLTRAARDLVSFISDRETLSECLNVVLDELETTGSFTVPGHIREIFTLLTKDVKQVLRCLGSSYVNKDQITPITFQEYEPNSDTLSQNITDSDTLVQSTTDSDTLSQNTTDQVSDTGPPEPFVDSARLAVIANVLSYGAEQTNHIEWCCHKSLSHISGFQKAQYFPDKWVLHFQTARHANNALGRPVHVGSETFHIREMR